MSKRITTYVLLTCCFVAFAQQQLPCFAPTPTAASIARFGDVPVSPFTGLPSISIPLYSFNVVGLELPLRLDYDASGVQMNVLPGWVGHNWSLAAGGVITRTVNDIPDEYICPSHDPYRNKLYNYFSSQYILPDVLNNPNAPAVLKAQISGEYIYDMDPDVFTFNFLGHSGKFFLGNDCQWKVVSDENLDVEFDVLNYEQHLLKPFISKYPSNAATDDQPGTIEGFRIIDSNGYVYEFGFDTSAIEYTTDFMRQSQNEKYASWIATSWYLKTIKNKFGNTLYSFTYTRGEFMAQFCHAYQSVTLDGYSSWTSNEFFGTGGGYSFCGLQANNNISFPYSAQLTAPVYLRRIDAADNTFAEFNTTAYDQSEQYSSLASIHGNAYNYLRAVATAGTGSQGNIFDYLENVKYSDYHVHELSASGNTDLFTVTGTRRLNNIKIGTLFNTDEYNIIRFDYSETGRPHLVQVRWEEPYNGTGVADKKYKLLYDRYETVPSDYLTYSADHWGYYRSQAYPSSYSGIMPTFAIYRTPEEDYIKRGSLTGIVYPTGGMTAIEYEANTFSVYQSLDRSQMVDSMGVGGGLRVKSIKNYEDTTQVKLLSSKEFSYNNPNTITSSGELFALPVYYWEQWQACTSPGTGLNVTTFRNSSIIPLSNSFGPIVGYSWVEERNSDGSKTIYHYSNLSTTQHDQLSVLNGLNTSDPSPYDRFSEFGFMRGKLLSKNDYDSLGTQVQSTAFTYRSDIDDSQSVLCCNILDEVVTNDILFYKGRVYRRYYPKYDVASKTTTLIRGNVQSVTTETYTYSDRHLLRPSSYAHLVDIRSLDAVTKVRGNSTEQTTYDYTYTTSESLPRSLFSSAFDLSVIGEKYYRNQQLAQENITEYNNYNILNANWPMPVRQIRIYSDQSRDTLVTYHAYNKMGLPYIYQLSGEGLTALSWKINDCVLGSKYVGKTWELTGFSDEDHITSDWMRDNARLFLYSIDDGMMYLYSYYPLNGVASITAPNGITTYYDYGRMGVLNLIKDDNFNTIKQFQLNYRLK